MSEERLVILFVPALVDVLRMLEAGAGRPLSEAEVVDARNRAVGTTVRPDVALKMAASRGYADLDPENVWEEWQSLRKV